MILAILAEAASRAFLLGGLVWLGLSLFRVRNPNAHMTAWVMVLLASLSMPLLMHWTTVTVTVHAPPMPAPEHLLPAETALPERLGAPPSPEHGIAAAPRSDEYPVNWWAIATLLYASVTGLLLLRLALGLHLAWRLARAARPLREDWTADWDVRVSHDIGGPVTAGSTILVPPDYADWDSTKRQAVLAHESAHIVNRDFYILLLASLNRAMFWFSPFAWWQLKRLAELAEIISDDRAIETLADRVSYAEVLLELVDGPQRKPAGLEMARACTVPTRLEIILAAVTLPPRLGWRKRLSIVAAIVPFAIVSAGSIAYRMLPASAHAVDGASKTMATARPPQHVDFYAISPGSVFAISSNGDDRYGQLTGQRRLRLAALQDGNYSYSSAAGEITFANDDRQPGELKLRQYGRDVRAIRVATLPGESAAPDKAPIDQYVGWYALAANRVLTVTRDGDRVLAQETGRPAFEVTARGADTFSAENDDLVFLRNKEAMVTRVLYQDSLTGPRIAPRIDAAKAKSTEAAFAQRVAAVSNRFTEQAPAPGGKDAVLRGIADLQNGTPNYDRMTPWLAAKIRRQASELHTMFASLGAVEQIFFRGVGPGGYDIYGVKFTNGSAEIRLSLAPDGKASDVILRADGNDKAGDVTGCVNETDLKPRNDVPITMTLFNNTGNEIRIYNLDDRGNRASHGTIGDNMSSSILTHVDSPWIITDRSGQCLQIVLPGQRTRYHSVEASGATGVPLRTTSARNAPQAGSEESLRRYILALGEGQPDYERMTPEVAARTRQQLPYEQAIVGRLGKLRALSFRGVSALGSDIYMVHFANGTAEWRIGLTREGAIGRIALGPQY